MNLLSDIITYVRRLIKSPSNSQITDSLITDYINRFWIMDVDARLQLFDLKCKYQFQTQPGVDQYNMPLYAVQSSSLQSSISYLPVYQGFLAPAKVNGINVPFYTQRNQFYDLWPNYTQSLTGNAIGNGTPGPYTIQLPFAPATTTPVNQIPSGILRGHVDITGVIAANNAASILNPVIDPIFGDFPDPNIPYSSIYPAVYITSIDAFGNSVVVQDSGQFLLYNLDNYANLGLLMNASSYPGINYSLNGPYTPTENVVNYQNGIVYVTFPTAIPDGQNINTQCYYFEAGLPRAILFYNNILTVRNPPDIQYLIELDAYLTPAAFLSTSQAVQFGYMSEYISRGAARKILADTGDWEQFDRYEQLFKEQETLVWKRSQRQFTATRTETIYSNSGLGSAFSSSNGLYGAGAT